MQRYATRSLAALACGASLALAACSDTTGPGVGEAQVVLSSDAVSANVVGEGISLSVGDVPESAIGGLLLNITRVDLHLVGGSDVAEGEGAEGEGESGEDGGGWITLEVALTEPLDLLTLSETGVQLADGTVTAGRYNQARFFFDTSELILDEAVDVNGTMVDAGSYEVTVPSADQTGLKLSLSGVEVGDGETETVAVEIGMGATMGTLLWNAGGFRLAPVLKKK